VRCPECGFHYDAKALVWVATFDEAARLSAARILIVRATAAAALAAPSGCLSTGFGGWSTLFLLTACFLGAFVAWAVYADHYDGIESIPLLFIIFCGAALFYWIGLIIFPPALLIYSAFALLTAWLVRLRFCPAPPPPENVRYADLHLSAQRQCLVGDILLVSATLLVLVVYLSVV
jgi:hypothetical protein